LFIVHSEQLRTLALKVYFVNGLFLGLFMRFLGHKKAIF